MIKAFVFGKFLPFHMGHESMIKFALTKCDFLSIIICVSDKEKIMGSVRKKWIEETFLNQQNVNVIEFPYDESELPNTSVSSETVSALWARVFKRILPEQNLLITSEPYGDYVAQYMKISHTAFDPTRIKTAVSGTAIRANIFAHWNFLPDSVKNDLAIKVVILGTESTGKTTLSEKLAAHFGCSLVSEAGRDLIPDSNSFSPRDLEIVAIEHANRIRKASRGNSPLILVDTDITITRSYSRFFFNTDLIVTTEIEETNKADLYLYLNNDVDFFQDGTRLTEEERNKLDKSHRQIVAEHNIKINEITGDWDQRLKSSIILIDELIAHKTRIAIS